MFDQTTKEALVQQAKISSQYSYSPYSHFAVGAALLCANQTIIHGANIENVSFGLTNCAERSALYAALSQGITQFSALAIYSPMATDYLTPCGACRQVLSEFLSPSFPILLANAQGAFIETTLGDLFPMQFNSLGQASDK